MPRWLGNKALMLLHELSLLNPNLSFQSGLAGLLPQHPRTYMTAWRNREELGKRKLLEETEEAEKNAEN